MRFTRSSTPPPRPDKEVRTDAPDAPDARVLALDVGVYGHRGSISSMFWYRRGGVLHAHVSELLPDEATLQDQLDVLEALAESYPEYYRVSPVVVVGVTVLSRVGRQEVRAHLDSWFNPPHRRRLVSIGDYAAEQTGTRGLISRQMLRDLIATRLTERTITLTKGQHDAIALYTGKRVPPGRDADDEWRADETDAVALPVALSCLATKYLLPPPAPTEQQQARAFERTVRAWRIQHGLSEAEAVDRALRQGHPAQANATGGGMTSWSWPGPETPIFGASTRKTEA